MPSTLRRARKGDQKMIFHNRAEAGIMLAEKLAAFINKDALLLAIPRGGVVVAAEIARAFNLNLDLIIPRKIGAPHNREMAIGAVTQDGTTLLNEEMLGYLGISRADLEDIIAFEIREINRRMQFYGAEQNINKITGRQLIVVDDGVATGYTMQAALISARKYGPKELVFAIPVAPLATFKQLEQEVDRAVCLHVPENFYAVSQFYEEFEQTEDETVIELMREFAG